MPRLDEQFFTPVVAILTMRRMMRGISQAELNEAIGCADNHLAKWEAGLFRPSIYFLLLWCAALDYRLQLKDIGNGNEGAAAALQAGEAEARPEHPHPRTPG